MKKLTEGKSPTKEQIAKVESVMISKTEDGWFKDGKWNGKPALCRRVSVKVGPAPGITFYWSNLQIGKTRDAIQIVVFGTKKQPELVKGVVVKRPIPWFRKPFYIDNENGSGQKLVLNQLSDVEKAELQALPGSEGKLYRIVYPTDVILETEQ